MSGIISEIRSQLLDSYNDISYFITRTGNVLEYGSTFNLSLNIGEEEEGIIKNRKLLTEKLGIGEKDIDFPEQCHTDNIEIVNDKMRKYKETDALITNKKRIYLAVLAADCVPIILYDREKKVIAAVHAGWRGTEKKIVQKTVLKMVDNFNCKPFKIIAFIGPSICKNCYQIGYEVYEKFVKIGYSKYMTIDQNEKGKANLDLWEINQNQLLESGLSTSNIEISGICTFETNWLFSARRDGFGTGRFGVGIMIC